MLCVGAVLLNAFGLTASVGRGVLVEVLVAVLTIGDAVNVAVGGGVSVIVAVGDAVNVAVGSGVSVTSASAVPTAPST